MTNAVKEPSQLQIWNISMSGYSYFIVDLWRTPKRESAPTPGEISLSRILVSNCTIVEMAFSNIIKQEVLEYSIDPVDEPEVAHKYQLTIKTAEGRIVVRGIHAFELEEPPVLQM